MPQEALRHTVDERFYEKVIKVKADVAALLIFLFFDAFATFPQKILR
jgi:hypothetical protein